MSIQIKNIQPGSEQYTTTEITNDWLKLFNRNEKLYSYIPMSRMIYD